MLAPRCIQPCVAGGIGGGLVTLRHASLIRVSPTTIRPIKTCTGIAPARSSGGVKAKPHAAKSTVSISKAASQCSHFAVKENCRLYVRILRMARSSQSGTDQSTSFERLAMPISALSNTRSNIFMTICQLVSVDKSKPKKRGWQCARSAR